MTKVANVNESGTPKILCRIRSISELDTKVSTLTKYIERKPGRLPQSEITCNMREVAHSKHVEILNILIIVLIYI